MPEADLLQTLAHLFAETGRADYQAYIETDGFDPEWPLWYADYLYEKLGGLLNAQFTRSELVYWLVLVDKEHRLHAPAASWPTYYADFFSQRRG